MSMRDLEEDDRGRNENNREDMERTWEGTHGKEAMEISGHSLVCLLGVMRIIFIYIFVRIARIYKWKGDLTIRPTKHSLLASYITQNGLCSDNQLWQQWICRAIKLENLFSDHRSEDHHGHVPSYIVGLSQICFLTTTRGHLPLSSNKLSFPDDAGFRYLLLKASGSNNICSFTEIMYT